MKWGLSLLFYAASVFAEAPPPTGTPRTSPFDPKGYLHRQPAATDGGAAVVKEAETKINGIPYVVYTSGGGSIILPKVGRFRPSDLDSSQCTHGGSDDFNEAPIVGAEQELSKKMTIYAHLIQQTIVSKCGETSRLHVNVNPDPEVGIRFRDNGKRDSHTIKLYKRLSEPGIGAGIEF
jgi:hypothetical protein